MIEEEAVSFLLLPPPCPSAAVKSSTANWKWRQKTLHIFGNKNLQYSNLRLITSNRDCNRDCKFLVSILMGFGKQQRIRLLGIHILFWIPSKLLPWLYEFVNANATFFYFKISHYMILACVNSSWMWPSSPYSDDVIKFTQLVSDTRGRQTTHSKEFMFLH